MRVVSSSHGRARTCTAEVAVDNEDSEQNSCCDGPWLPRLTLLARCRPLRASAMRRLAFLPLLSFAIFACSTESTDGRRGWAGWRSVGRRDACCKPWALIVCRMAGEAPAEVEECHQIGHTRRSIGLQCRIRPLSANLRRRHRVIIPAPHARANDEPSCASLRFPPVLRGGRRRCRVRVLRRHGPVGVFGFPGGASTSARKCTASPYWTVPDFSPSASPCGKAASSSLADFVRGTPCGGRWPA